MTTEDALRRLEANFHARAESWKLTTNDPHNIAGVLYVVMSECENAVREALSDSPEMIAAKLQMGSKP